MNYGKWTTGQIGYLKEHLGRIPFRDIADHLGKTERAVRLFVHRKRLIASMTPAKKNIVLELLTYRFGNPEYFTPTREFYKALGISQIKWGRLYRGQDSLTTPEYKALAKHFNISIDEAIDLRQLDLFKDTQEQ